MAALISTLFMPQSPVNAEGESTVTISVIEGVTPPVAGAKPVQSISLPDNYSGTIVWESTKGELASDENFEANTIYVARIYLTPAPGKFFAKNSFIEPSVADASRVTSSIDESSAQIDAFFFPELGNTTDYLDDSFRNAGSVSMKDIFGESPLNESGTVVGPIKVDQIAVDAEDRIVVLASFYGANNQDSEVSGADRVAVGTGYENSVNIASQFGNGSWSSAAKVALEYTTTVGVVEFTDWYLPSIDELQALYAQREIAGGMKSDESYWSSSQLSATVASGIYFANGSSSIESESKSSLLYVRPIRAATTANPVIGDVGPGGGKIFYVSPTPFACGEELLANCNYLEVAPANWFDEVGDPLRSWAADFRTDNHILFRLNENGSYDQSFGDPSITLQKNEDDEPKPYVLVTTTCPYYKERVNLKIDSENRILVKLSGSADEDTCSGHHNFVARYTSEGEIDISFGDDGDGVIGALEPQLYPIESLYDQFVLDTQNRIVIASLSYETPTVVVVERFSQNGLIDTSFGTSGVMSLDVGYPNDPGSPSCLVEGDWDYIAEYGSISCVRDNAGNLRWIRNSINNEFRYLTLIADASGYVVGYTGTELIDLDNGDEAVYTTLVRININGILDGNFQGPLGSDEFILPDFFLTNLVSDGPSGFFISGTSFDPTELSYLSGLTLRLVTNGNLDVDFSGLGEVPWLSPLFSEFCANSAVHRNFNTNQSTIGVMVGNFCEDGGRLKVFTPSGAFQGEFSFATDPFNPALQFVNQIITTNTGNPLILSGVIPVNGLFGYLFARRADLLEQLGYEYWDGAVISRYTLTEESIATPPAPPPTPTPIYAPTPIPYLKTLSLPRLNLKDGKLVCVAGAYNAGYTLDGVIQGSATSLFTPATYTYDLNINGVVQSSLTNTSANPTTSWDMPSAISASLITCSVTVTANGVTNIDRSSDNAAGVSAAKAALSTEISKVESDYSALLNANEKAYQKALIDNRSKWRNDADTLRKNYQAEIAAIRALPSTKETRGSSLVALKNYTAAVKKNSADYKASKPAALAERDAANKTALDAKSAAVASANAAYGSFIESIGYGVLVP